MIPIELLDRVQAFQKLDDKQRAKLHIYCHELKYRMGDKLFSEKDPARHLWTVIEGKVDLRFEMPDNRQTNAAHTVTSVNQRQEEDKTTKTLGWSCFVPPYKMRLSAYCVTETCRIIRIEKNDLLQAFEEDPLTGYRFMTYMVTVVGYRFHQFQDQVAKTTGESLMSGW